jgi:hypothetical protein
VAQSRTRAPARPGPILSRYDGVYLDCRNLGHVWRIAGYYREGDAVLRRLECQRCGTERTDRWRRDGFRPSARYHYVDGYRMTEGEPVTPTDVRAEMMRRATIYKSQEEMLAAMTGGEIG